MTKKQDPDVLVLRAANKNLLRSSSTRMLIANVEFLYDYFVRHPSKEIPVRLRTYRKWQKEKGTYNG